ncbi:MAG: HAD family hydrolase [Candidatus Micrarchaeota archaeon]|nr:HAD family hydrolase [Candidatus Micrarchaeota archaeon]
MSIQGIRLIVFDVGGVLRDASRLVGEGYRRGMLAHGFTFPFEPMDVLHFRGLAKYNNPATAAKGLIAIERSGVALPDILKRPDAEEEVDRIVAAHGKPSDDDTAKRIGMAYKELFESPEGSTLVGQTRDAEKGITLLKGKGYKLGIFTNGALNTISRDVPYHEKFDVFVSEQDITRKKPSGEGIVVAMEKAGATKSETAYVGDSVSDIQAARDAGCSAFAVLCGYGLESHLVKEKPDAVFNNVIDLAERMPSIKNGA